MLVVEISADALEVFFWRNGGGGQVEAPKLTVGKHQYPLYLEVVERVAAVSSEAIDIRYMCISVFSAKQPGFRTRYNIS